MIDGLMPSVWFSQCIDSGTSNRNDRDFWQGSPAGEIRFNAHKEHIMANSLIVEVGGNIGEDTEEYVKRYEPEVIYIVEPIPQYVAKLKARFALASNVRILPFGLGKQNGSFSFCESGGAGEATSAFTSCSNPIDLPIRSAWEVMQAILKETGRSHVDLLSINCEGCEYDSIESLIDHDLLDVVKTLQFSRHKLEVPNLVARLCRIEERIYELFNPIYLYPWCWEAHRLKEWLWVK
jgi:FkbM family methyltransferase